MPSEFLLNGHVQLWMLPGERMALIGFRERPQLSIGMQVEVAQQTVETDAYSLLAAPIESIIYDSLSKLVEGRRRILFPIEIDPPLRMEAVDGDVKIRLIGCTGLPGASELSRYQVTAYNAELQVELKSRVS